MTHTAIRTLSALAALALVSAFAGSTPSAGQSSSSANITGTVRDPQTLLPSSKDAQGLTTKEQEQKTPKGIATKKGSKASGGLPLYSSFHNNDN